MSKLNNLILILSTISFIGNMIKEQYFWVYISVLITIVIVEIEILERRFK